ncbi:MAG: hypothetical protein LJE87_02270, partial [Deltaproteobacteria bacterium]|nr:hypothetical protein [Deltaproteobacteria bacterium]
MFTLIIMAPPEQGNSNVDPITEQIVDDWHGGAKVCPDCQHTEIDWECVWGTVDFLTGGSFKERSNEIKVTLGMAGGIDLIVEYYSGAGIGVGAVLTTWGASII